MDPATFIVGPYNSTAPIPVGITRLRFFNLVIFAQWMLQLLSKPEAQYQAILGPIRHALLQNWLEPSTSLQQLRAAIGFIRYMPNLQDFAFANLHPDPRLVVYHRVYSTFTRNLHHFVLHAANEYLLQCVIDGREPPLRFKANFGGMYSRNSGFHPHFAALCAESLDTAFERDLICATLQISIAWRRRHGNMTRTTLNGRRAALDTRSQQIEDRIRDFDPNSENQEPMSSQRNIFEREG
ncbi:uncharacterized protein BDR25DRAFT_310564 [Lindgomyces ingoldianus]|uniref:Uncharacterized protein n=1 Tax=Lindgomyces ingoldianus TaxID=673940 RepID=A0ACB6R7P6_9PLEO|nr:uncharacterized protein BDR25DRAFT_310564 [Lindgomyces ingoldianus]KAF2475112.1 hypothetical protein BDR25DRAFT_310564 [Lindgomyces ingoldianus]